MWTTIYRQKTQFLYLLFKGAIEPGKSLGRWNLGKILAINEPKFNRRKFIVFDKQRSKSSEINLFCNPVLSLRILFEAKILLVQERHNHRESYITVEVSRGKQKFEIYLADEVYDLEFFGTDLGHFFGSNVGNDFEVILWEKGPHKQKLAYDIVHIHHIMIYTDMI